MLFNDFIPRFVDASGLPVAAGAGSGRHHLPSEVEQRTRALVNRVLHGSIYC